MRLKPQLLQLLAVVATIALSNAVPLNRFDSDGNNLRLDRRNGSFDSEFGSECEHNGRVYQNGERLENPENPCNVCYCRGGEVSCTALECYRRDDCEPQYVPGRCCPRYDHCPPLDQPRFEKTRPQFIRTDFNRDATASVDPTVQQRNGLFDLDNEASEDVTATAVTTATLERHTNSTSAEGSQGLTTVKLQTTDDSPVFNDDHHDISVKQNIGDEVQFTADNSETLRSESRIVPVVPKLIPVTQQPAEDKVPSTTSSFSREEGSGTTSLNLNDGAVSSSTEGLEAGSETKLDLDVSSGDGEGSGTQELEQRTESNLHSTSGNDNPHVHIISGTSESVESNEVVTDPTTVDYSRTITKKESTKEDEQFTTVTEISRTSPPEDIKTESFLVNEKSNIGETSVSGEVETVTKQNSAHQTNPSEYFTTTGEDVTDSNEVIDNGKATQHLDVKLRISSDELTSESEESKEKKTNSSEEGSITITDQDIIESKTNPTEASLTTLPEAPVNSNELKRVNIISSSIGVRVYNAEKDPINDDTQQQTATESFINLENELPGLPIGSVLMNNEMDVVLATTEVAQPTNNEEISTTFSLLQADAQKLTPAEIATEESSTEHIPRATGVQQLSLNEEAVAAGSDISQKLVFGSGTEHTGDPTEITMLEQDQNSSDTPTAVPVLIKLASLLTSQSVDEATVLQSTDKTDRILPTTTEITLQEETTVNQEQIKSEDNQKSAISGDEDLTTLPSELDEITAVTESFKSADTGKSTATPNLEESTTVLPETVGNTDQIEISHSQLAEIKVRKAVDSFNTEESTTTFTEAPKLGRTVVDEFSTLSPGHEFKESEEATTEHSFIESTTDNMEAFIRLASNPSNIHVDTASSEVIGTTRSQDVTESNDKAMLRDAPFVQLKSATEQSAEVETTTSQGDQELSNTNNDNIRTEIYQQDATEALGSHDAVTELPAVEQRSGLKNEPSESSLNDSSSTAEIFDFSTTSESITQHDNAEGTTSVPDVTTLLGAGSSNLGEKVAVKLLEEHKAEASVSEEISDQPNFDNQDLKQAGESSTALDGLTTKLPNEDEFSTEGAASHSVETFTLLSEQSEQKKKNIHESEPPKLITISSGESFTTLQSSSEVDIGESTTQYSAEETTLKGVHVTTPQSSGTANIKREIPASEQHTSNEPEQGTEDPTTSKILSDDSLLHQRASDFSSTEEVESFEGTTTEISKFNLNNSETHEKVELASLKQEETYTSTPEASTMQGNSFAEDSTHQYAESSTNLYIEDVTKLFHESGEKKEVLAPVALESNQTDTEIESTTLPREWLKSDNSSEITETPNRTSETVTDAEAKENPTLVTEISLQGDIQESVDTEETTVATRPTAVHEDKSVGTNSSIESSSTTINRNITNTGTDESNNVAKPEHVAKARSVDNFDINLGNDNGFIRPEESGPNDEFHSSLIGHDLRDPENFRMIEDFFTRLFHRQDADREDDAAVI
ncbi:uncharacterized protein [Anabrus simplex]|uniref:uncharacterized protein isoform X2 n=1 Tax=Anabrus simplex TaxID=316456 RepID=UPI0035A30469